MSLDVRDLLDRSAMDAPPSDWVLDDVIRRARAARVRRHRLVAAGVAAALVVGVGAALVVPRTGDGHGSPTSPATSATTAGTGEMSSSWESQAWQALVRVEQAVTSLGYTVTEDTPSAVSISPGAVTLRVAAVEADRQYVVDATILPLAQGVDDGQRLCARVATECTARTRMVAGGEQDGVGSYSVTYVRPGRGVDYVAAERVYSDGATVQLVLSSSDDPTLTDFAASHNRRDALVRMLGMLGHPDLMRRDAWGVATTYPDGWVPEIVSVPIPSLEVPAVVDGEVARAVLSDSSESHNGKPDASVTYVVRAACLTTDRSDELQYEVRDDSANGKWAVVSSGSVPCDGTVIQNSASPLPSHRVTIGLIGPADASGYAVLVPYPSLAEQQKQNRENEATQQRDTTQQRAQDAQEQQLALQHPCAAGDLSATAQRVEGGTQTYAVVLTFTNTSGAACGVSGVPSIRLEAGQPLGFDYTPGQYMIFLPHASDTPVLIQPGEAADLYLSKPGCAETTEAVARTAVVAVAGGEVDVRLPRSGQGELAYCGPAADDPGNLVRVTAFQARAAQ